MVPMIRYCASGKRACARSGVGALALSAPSPANPWAQDPMPRARRTRSSLGSRLTYLEGGRVKAVVRSQRAALGRELPRDRADVAVGAEVRGGDAQVAPERLGE